jgi:hypothetical protein
MYGQADFLRMVLDFSKGGGGGLDTRAAKRGGANCPEVLGALKIFCWELSLFCVLNISAQRTRYLGFFGLLGGAWGEVVLRKKFLNRGP